MSDPERTSPPTLEEMQQAAGVLAPLIQRTPAMEWRGLAIEPRLEPGTRVSMKLELLQDTGTFKARGALNNALALDTDQIAAGITAVSAGNHAIAAAYAAKRVGASAKVVMIGQPNPARVQAAVGWGALCTF